MRTETITWHAVADELPDDDTTVLLDFDAADAWPGYRESGKWYEPNGAEVGGVIAWADMPEGRGVEQRPNERKDPEFEAFMAGLDPPPDEAPK